MESFLFLLMILLGMALPRNQHYKLFTIFPVNKVNKCTSRLMKTVNPIMMGNFKIKHPRDIDMSILQNLFYQFNNFIYLFTIINLTDRRKKDRLIYMYILFDRIIDIL